MGQRDRIWLTTGQAARLCSVTPGTVLNWIRKGRLEGVRTAGGHYRIRREQLDPLLAHDEHERAPTGNGHDAKPMRCWEYLGDEGPVRDGCRSCVVYRLRAARCFRLAAFGPEIGHALDCCPTSCDECAYYRRVAQLPTRVLVVTADRAVVDGLQGDDANAMTLRFARNAYEAAAVAQEFLPAFAVVDHETYLARDAGLLESLACDRRLPGLKIVVAVPPDRPRPSLPAITRRYVAREIEKPFGSREIAAVIDSFPVETLAPSELEALSPHPREDDPMTQTHHPVLETGRDADGFLQELSTWNRSKAEALAVEADIGELTEDHWRVIEFVQWYYRTYGKGPPVVQIHKETGLSSNDICELFPCGMVKGAYRLAGLPRPPGCA